MGAGVSRRPCQPRATRPAPSPWPGAGDRRRGAASRPSSSTGRPRSRARRRHPTRRSPRGPQSPTSGRRCAVDARGTAPRARRRPTAAPTRRWSSPASPTRRRRDGHGDARRRRRAGHAATLRLEPREERRGPCRRHRDHARARRRGRGRRRAGGRVARARGAATTSPSSRAHARRRTDWYFADGTTVRGTQQYLALFNPFGDDAIVDVTFLTDTGVQEPDALQGVVVPRRSRVSIPVHDGARATDPRRGSRPRPLGRRRRRAHAALRRHRPTRACRRARASRCRSGRRRRAATWEFPCGTHRHGGTRIGRDRQLRRHRDHRRGGGPRGRGGGRRAEAGRPSRRARSSRSTSPRSRPIARSRQSSVTARDAEGDAPPVVAEMLASWPPDVGERAAWRRRWAGRRDARRWVVALPELGADAGDAHRHQPGAQPVTRRWPSTRRRHRGRRAASPSSRCPPASSASFDVTASVESRRRGHCRPTGRSSAFTLVGGDGGVGEPGRSRPSTSGLTAMARGSRSRR